MFVQLSQENKTQLPTWRWIPSQEYCVQGNCKRWMWTSKKVYCFSSTTFKERLRNLLQSFKPKSKANSPELSKYIWRFKDKDKDITDFNIKCSIIQRQPSYNSATKRCNICLSEKYFIMISSKNSTANKCSKLIANCRHRNKYILINYGITWITSAWQHPQWIDWPFPSIFFKYCNQEVYYCMFSITALLVLCGLACDL